MHDVRMRRYSEEQLRTAVAQSTCLRQVLSSLGLRPAGGNYERLRAQIADAELDTSHFDRLCALPEVTYTDQQLRAVVADSRSLAAAMHALRLEPVHGNYHRLRYRMEALGLDYDELRLRGRVHRVTSRRRAGSTRQPLEQVLTRGALQNSNRLRQRLIREGLLEPVCARCGLGSWLGNPVPLELDHENGDRYDNRLVNLRLLCPNCHALTPTYRGRNQNRARKQV